MAPSPEIGQLFQDHGINTSIAALPAYVPSRIQPSIALEASAPRSLLNRPGVTLVVSAYRVLHSGCPGDLYGLDVAAETFAAAATDPTIKRAFLVAPPGGRRPKRYLRSVLDMAKPENGRTSSVLDQTHLLPPFGTHWRLSETYRQRMAMP